MTQTPKVEKKTWSLVTTQVEGKIGAFASLFEDPAHAEEAINLFKRSNGPIRIDVTNSEYVTALETALKASNDLLRKSEDVARDCWTIASFENHPRSKARAEEFLIELVDALAKVDVK